MHVRLSGDDADRAIITIQNGTVIHIAAGVGFGQTTKTPEAEFRSRIAKVTYVSSYDKR